jgi:hypothetical protein
MADRVCRAIAYWDQRAREWCDDCHCRRKDDGCRLHPCQANATLPTRASSRGRPQKATRYRSWLPAQGLKIFADVHVKHGAHAIVANCSIPELTGDLEFSDADVVIATGERTGDRATRGEMETRSCRSAMG